jgi:hypothetical protein
VSLQRTLEIVVAPPGIRAVERRKGLPPQKRSNKTPLMMIRIPKLEKKSTLWTLLEKKS